LLTYPELSCKQSCEEHGRQLGSHSGSCVGYQPITIDIPVVPGVKIIIIIIIFLPLGTPTEGQKSQYVGRVLSTAAVQLS